MLTAQEKERLEALERELARLKGLLEGLVGGVKEASLAPPAAPPSPPPPPPKPVPVGRLVGHRVRPALVWGAIGLARAWPLFRGPTAFLEAKDAARVGALASAWGRYLSWEGALREASIEPPSPKEAARVLALLRPALEAHVEALVKALEARADFPQPAREAALALLREALEVLRG